MLSIRLIPVALLGALLFTGCGGATARYERSIERGEKYLAAGDLDKARVEFRNAIQIDPKAADARFHAGVVAERRQDFRDALVMYKSAIDIQPDYPEARANYARIFVFGGSPDLALQIVGEGLAKHPDDPELLVVRGAAFVQTKKPVEARADAERAVKLAPDNENALALLSSIQRAAGERAEALALLAKALERKPGATNLRRIRASLEIENGDDAAAEASLVKAIELDPKQLAIRYELTNFYLRKPDLDGAQRTLEAAVAAFPGSNDAKLTLANFLATQRTRESGEKALRALIAQDPDNLELQLGLGALLERSNAGPEAVEVYEQIAKHDPASVNGLAARNRIASRLAERGETAAAQAALDEILKDNTRDAAALALRARLATESGNPSAAIVDLRSLLRESPSSIDAYRMLARAHIANGEPALAEEALRKALDFSPTDTMLRVELAQFLTRSGRSGIAVGMLEDATRRTPNDAGVREALVRAYVETGALPEAERGAEDLKLLLPRSPIGYYLRGQIAQLSRDPATAEREFESALAVEPRAFDVLAALSRLRLANGRGDVAVVTIGKALEGDARNPVLNNLLGELLIGSRQPAKAVAPLARAIEAAPKWWLPYRNLAVARYQSNDADGAVAAYLAGRKQAPAEALLVVDLAALYELRGRVDDAVKVYEEFHAANPRNDLVTNNLAKLLLAHRNDADSLGRAVALTAPFANSPDPVLLDTYGWTMLRKGDFAAARTVLERAFAAAPDSGSIRYHLALVQVQGGDLAKAIENLEIAVATPRGFVGLAEARTLLTDLKTRVG
jgi:Tfp pilus assembly protein PilF